MQKGRGSVSLWGCMISEGIDNLVFYDGRVNGQTYIHVIGDTLIPFIKQRFKNNAAKKFKRTPVDDSTNIGQYHSRN